MSDYIDTREGWREVTEGRPADRERRLLELDAEGHIVRGWVYEEPVSPLPTEPYTVIRVSWRDGGQSVLARQGLADEWTWVETQHHATSDEVHAQGIESFELLAEPRAVTAWAVLDRVSDMPSVKVAMTAGDFRKVADEFGVES